MTLPNHSFDVREPKGTTDMYKAMRNVEILNENLQKQVSNVCQLFMLKAEVVVMLLKFHAYYTEGWKNFLGYFFFMLNNALFQLHKSVFNR